MLMVIIFLAADEKEGILKMQVPITGPAFFG